MSSPRSSSLFLPLAAALSLTCCLGNAAAQAPVKARQVPSLVSSGKASVLGAYNQNEELSLVVNLALRHEDEVDALLAQLQDPASKHFRHYLTPAEFDARFGPTRASYEAVLSWAEANGFTVVRKAANNRLVELKAPVSAINRALHVTLTAYHDARLNRNFYAPDREPTVDLDVPLASIEGLENSEPIHNNLMTRPRVSGPKTARDAGGAASPRIVGSAPDGEYLPSDMRAAYYGSGPLTGAGQSVAIFSFDGYLASDLTIFYAQSGTTGSVPVTNRLAGGYAGTCYADNSGIIGTCADAEQILDIVNVQGMAPGLDHIYFYESSSASAELNLMVTDNLAKVISCSWGGGGFGTASDTYFKQMATQGQSFLNATGDSGAFNGSNYSAASLDPYIIQVGGTSLLTTGAGGPWASETAWPYSSGGFWVSSISTSGQYPIPSWQSTAGVITVASGASSTYRNVPDISAEADFDNPTVSNGTYLTGEGGTSYAAPRLAGYMALANQYAVANGGSPLGFFNPLLYTGMNGAGYSSFMHDVTAGSNPASSGTGVYYAVAGFDDVTGWGSPNGDALLYYLAALPSYSLSSSVGSMTVTRGTTGNTGTMSINVAASNGFTGTVAVMASGLPKGVSYTATSGTSSTPPTLTFTADAANAIQGTYPINVTGTATVGSNTVTRTTSFALTILKRANGDFTIFDTHLNVMAGTTLSTNVKIQEGAIAGPIALTLSGAPAGVTVSLASSAYDNPGTIGASVTGNDAITFTIAPGIGAGVYPILITGTSLGNIVHVSTFTLTITVPTSYVLNGGFETVTSGTAVTSWSIPGNKLEIYAPYAHSGNNYILLDGYGGGANITDTVSQSGITIPAGKTSATVGFWMFIITSETTTTSKIDTMTVNVTPSGGSATAVLALSNLDQGTGYVYRTVDVSAFIGQTVTLSFVGFQKSSVNTAFLLDDVSLFCNPN